MPSIGGFCSTGLGPAAVVASRRAGTGSQAHPTASETPANQSSPSASGSRPHRTASAQSSGLLLRHPMAPRWAAANRSPVVAAAPLKAVAVPPPPPGGPVPGAPQPEGQPDRPGKRLRDAIRELLPPEPPIHIARRL